MIVVKVELWSAVDGRHTELGRMTICNDGVASRINARRGDYVVATMKGRDAETLDKNMRAYHGGKIGASTRRGGVNNYARLDKHVWNLVGKALGAMGYDVA